MIEVNIYVLKDPHTQEIRYVGRTKNSLKIRLNGHYCKAKQNKFKTHKDNWIISLKEKVLIELLEKVTGWEESYKREQEIIADLLSKGFKLTNLHDRGIGGLLRDISEEMKIKISKKLKQLHQEGKLTCNRKAVDVYDLNGNFVESFKSYKDCANFIKISQKQLQSSMRRKAKRVKQYQVISKGNIPPGKWKQRTGEIIKNFRPLFVWDTLDRKILVFESNKKFKEEFKVNRNTIEFYRNKAKLFRNRYLITNARVKLDELLGSLEADYQQPSLGSV